MLKILAERWRQGHRNTVMGTLKGFPNPPALWLRRAKPAYAYAIMNGNPGLKPPRPAQRGEVAERSEAGEGLSRFMPERSEPSARWRRLGALSHAENSR